MFLSIGMLKQKYFLADIFILSAEKQPIKLSWRKIECLQMENKLKLFQGKSIRSAWNEEEQQWYFSILDVVQVLTDNAMLSNIQSECVQEMKC